MCIRDSLHSDVGDYLFTEERMAKGKSTAYFCSDCGYESAKWTGQCPACKSWNTMVEEPVSQIKTVGKGGTGSARKLSLIHIFTGVYEKAADVNGNGKVDIMDILAMQKDILGIQKLN